MTQTAVTARQKTVERTPEAAELRVLHFVPRVCWPLNTGAKLRNYHLARELSRRARVTLLAFSESEERPEDAGGPTRRAQEAQAQPALESPERFYEQVITVARDRGYTPAKIVRGALGRTPLPVLNYTTPAMKQALESALGERHYDVVQVESVHLAEYLPIIRAAKGRPLVICDWHNIESELMWRYSERQTSPWRAAYARRASRQMRSLERRAVRDFDAHIVVSGRDGARLLADEPAARVHVIENGVDTSYYADEPVRRAHAEWLARADGRGATARPDAPARSADVAAHERHRVVFVGSMDYHANVDAAVSFTKEVWPRLSEQRPELTFTIVGREPAPEVRALAQVPGVEVTGTVDDVRPYYQEALCSIIPLRVGGGSRLKILEAMAAGVPVVSTELGAEGLDVRDGENIILAETGDDFREAIIDLGENEERRGRLRAGGRALVSERYDWSTLGTALFAKYQGLLAEDELTEA
ncbi:MAG TPA: glycosyltransferase [Pyrinomonadaceae bacterium]|nr:glycosyltransferase [Pyrinomonadaceae bacterium]